jgi:DNA-directed RNA polymerase specialized sigma24 family protein
VPPAFASSTPDDDPDLFADLIERIARDGDRAAFARLFAYFAPRLKGRLLSQGLTPEAAEDQAVAVMAAAWRQAASFDACRDTASTWMFRILRNASLDAAQPLRDLAESTPQALAARARPRTTRPALLHRFPLRQPPRIQPSNTPLISRG